jgi:exodeoxyribonuclease VII large subunit
LARVWSSQAAPLLGLPVIEAEKRDPGRLVWGVSALLRAVADSVDARFNPCTLRGEISGLSRAASGHQYFNLKDAGGSGELLRCAMFRRAAALLDFAPGDGQRVELRGRLDVYAARGELQMVVESMRREGEGALYEQFLRLKAKLDAEGLFDPARRRVLPAFARRVGVVTSLAAAALHDVATALKRRAPHAQVVVYPSKVQGVEAPAELVAALRRAGQRREVDVLIVCRGGGSLEDLWAFNDEQVVRAIAAMPFPVISGVGHESDVTLADLVADLRAATPTAAAELCVPARDDSLALLTGLARRLMRGSEMQLGVASQRLDRLAAVLTRPLERLETETLRLQALAHRLPVAVTATLHRADEATQRLASRMLHAMELSRTRRTHVLEHLATRLASCDPRLVVARGYAMVQLESGELVTAPEQLEPDRHVDVTLARGRARVRIAASERS